MKVKAALAAVAIAGGAVVATVGPASPALGFFSPPLLLEIHVNSPATLVAKGAGVNVVARVECSGASTAFVEVQLTQRVGSDTAIGFGSTEIGCATNANQNVLVLVTAQGGKAFRKGTAVADGFVSACTPNFRVCGSEQDQPTIDLTH
ncbi:MAG TPA: hypothetical protein VH589_22675 [Trebonia sp.]|jgi:hypothetical protein